MAASYTVKLEAEGLSKDKASALAAEIERLLGPSVSPRERAEQSSSPRGVGVTATAREQRKRDARANSDFSLDSLQPLSNGRAKKMTARELGISSADAFRAEREGFLTRKGTKRVENAGRTLRGRPAVLWSLTPKAKRRLTK